MDSIHLPSRAKGRALAAGLYCCITILVLATLYHTSNLNDRHMPVYKLQYSGAEISGVSAREMSRLSAFVSA
jgi:hypothetical protein